MMLTHLVSNGGSTGYNGIHEWAGFKNQGTSWTYYYYKHITFDSNGGTGSMELQTIENSGTLTANTMTRNGYVFAGWNTEADGRGIYYADEANVTATSEDKGPVKLYAQWLSIPNNLSGEFIQKDRKVRLTWATQSGSSPLNGTFVVYRNDTKIGTVVHSFDANGTTGLTFEDTNTATETNFPYEATVSYDVYLVPDGRDENTKQSDSKSSVTVSTTRTVPVSTSNAEGQADRIVFTWTSDGYPAGWGHKFKIYVDNETEPIYTITPTDNQTSFQWEHRTTDKHEDRQDFVDTNTGVPYTEEELNACQPHTYRIDGVIGDKVLNSKTFERKAIGTGTLFYSLDGTKGAYPGTVKLQWHVNQQGNTAAKTYIVDRRRTEKPDETWVTLYRTSSDEDYLMYTDDTPLPGVYYDYRVTVEDKCSDGTIIRNETIDIGFAQATGTVSGRITYGSSGSSVEGAEVTVLKADASDDETDQYHSMRFTGSNGAVTWKYPSTTYAADKLAQGNFTIQLWVNPETLGEAKMVCLNGETCYVGMDADGKLTLVNGEETYTFDNAALKAGQYNHVVLTRSGQNVTASVVGADEAGVAVLNSSTQAVGSLSLTDAEQLTLGLFVGYVDDFRFWTKTLTDAEILENYDHLLVGNEKQLETYWTFDEGLRTQFFDYSRDGTVYHQHHGKTGSNAEPSNLTPTQLKLKAKTDIDGNYVIQGIPFAGEGTVYNVTPVLNSHEFSPMKSSRFISTSSLVHNSVDFTDVSSFEVKGTILYAGTNIPVDSVTIQIDGRAVSRNNEMVVTNSYGEFVIDVPIGRHYLSAVKDGHTFVNEGRIPADPTGLNEATIEFKNPLSGLLFHDNTLVTVAGRVTGGAIEADKPIGFGQSKNTIGQAQITLEIPDTRYMLNAYEDNNGLVSNGYRPVTVNTPLTTPSDAASTGSAYRTGGDNEDDAKRVVITTDAATGEFAVLVPPLDYKVVSVRMVNAEARGVYTFPAEQLPRINASDPTTVLKDSIETEDGGFQYFEYVASLQQTKHTQPVLSVTQKGRGEGVFGDATAKYSYFDAQTGKNVQQEVDLYTVNSDRVTYNFDYPIFSEMGHYTFNLEGYELYTNYEKEETDASRVTKVPLQNTVVTISNALSADQKVYTAAEENGTNAGLVSDLKDNQLMLDDKGKATYTWQAGLPNIQSPFTRRLNMTYSNGAGDYSWQGLDAIIFGDLPTGMNFTTKGPTQVDMVLHDPYGDSSFATWESGKVSITSTDTLKFESEDINFATNIHLGPKLEFEQGDLFTKFETEIQVIADISSGFSYSSQRDSTNTHTTTIETTQAISTSADPDMVGADADIYIGSGTNLLFGEARSVGLKADASGTPEVVVDNSITVGQEFETTFFYTQYQIETKVIPDLIKLRNSYLITVPDMSTATNGTDETIYVTELSEDDEHFGEPETYKRLVKKEGQDMVQYYNTEIENWKKQIALSEEYKLSLFDSSKAVDKKNISFGGGVEISETSTREDSFSQTFSHQHSYIVDFSFDFGATLNEVGFDIAREQHKTENRMDNGYGENGVGSNGGVSSTTEEVTTATFSYTLADSGVDDAFSMNVYKASGNHGPVFRTLAGQSSCPYEGQEVTKYYEPGKELSAATVQMENPELACDNNLLTGVPTGGKAQFELLLRNNSASNTDAYFELVPVDGANPKGAKLSLPTGDIQGGRTVFVPAGETVKMILTLEQVNLAVTDYEDIKLTLRSSCQNDEGSIHGVIGSTVSLSAHFVPASTPVNMTVDRTVVNTNNVDEDLTVRVTGFDRLFAGLQRVDLQYMAPGAQTWSLLKGYIPNEGVRTDAAQQLLPEDGVIELSLSMKPSSWTDGTYRFRAQSSALYSGQPVTSESEVLTVVKDLSRPQLFGLASPSDGVLNGDDVVSITFNEDIQRELLTKNNFVVSGVLNGTKVQHDVALSAQNTDRAAYSEADINLSKKSFSTDLWVRATGDGDIFTHGNGEERFKASINDQNQLVITIGGESYISVNSIEPNTWTFLALSYSYAEGNSRMSACAVTANDTKDLFVNKAVADYDGIGSITLGGNFTGAIHELTLWDKERTMQEAQAEMYYTKKPTTPNLIGYWKMDEGDGKVIRDYVRNRHLTMPNDTWYLNNDNKAVSLSGSDALMLDITACNALPTDDYAVEMWFKGAKADNNGASTLFSACGGTPIGENPAPVVPSVSMGFDGNGDLTLSAHGTAIFSVPSSTFNLLDNAWHHLAMNVLRNGSATVYVDGTAVKAVAATAVPALEGATLYVGSQNGSDAFFKGAVDEIRLWNASMTGDLISRQRKERLTGEENGLVAYYSFEQMTRDPSTGIIASTGSAADLTGSGKEAQLTLNSQFSILNSQFTDDAPAMKVKPEATNVEFSYVANERSIVFTLNEEPARLEGATLTFNVKGVKDMNGNESNPVAWTAYVRQNSLLWKGDTELTLQKEMGHAASFEAVITNEGGNSENWSLSGLPTWLTASATSGTLKAQLQKTITFTVAESLPIGKYEQTVYLTGNSNISEPLTLSITVTGNVPNWAVTPNDYELSMNIIGRLEILGIPSNDENDLVAAFIGEECRGLAHMEYKERFDGYFVTMDIYGNGEDGGEEVTFRAYDASTGTIYPVIVANPTIKFASLALEGKYADPVELSVVNKIEQATELKKGWNWLSLYVTADDMKATTIFDKVKADVVAVKAQSQADGALAKGANGELTGTLTTLENTKMYAVQMAADRTLRVVGQPVSAEANKVTVCSGYNWIGYYGQQVASIGDALSGLDPQNDETLKGLSGIAYYDNGLWHGSLTTMMPGKGYILHSKDERQFSYSTTLGVAPSRMAQPLNSESSILNSQSSILNSQFSPIDYHLYADNMLMVARVMVNGHPAANTELGVFAGDECRTAVVTDSEGMAYVIIPGDETPAMLTFQIVVDGQTVSAVQTADYETDAICGSPAQPFLISTDATGIMDISNGQTRTDTDAYDLGGRKIVESKYVSRKLSKGVYIINGQKKVK